MKYAVLTHITEVLSSQLSHLLEACYGIFVSFAQVLMFSYNRFNISDYFRSLVFNLFPDFTALFEE